uniref:3-oxoacyl-[acyl-carrier-protein] reductase n=1 Tax=Parastrongyloides trichosuri TaxID=131310 RepID=A0A0N5A0U6_PARTI
GRHHHRRGGPGGQSPAVGQGAADRRASGARRGRRVHPGDADRVRHRLPVRHSADVRGADPAVQKLRLSGHHHGGPAPGHWRRLHRPGDRGQELLHVGPDRGADADGDRGQELHPAGRLHHHGREERAEPFRRHHGRRPQAGPADPDDHLRHGGGHGAHRHRLGRRRGVPLAHGRGRGRGADLLDLPVAALHPGGVHHHRRHRRLRTADAEPDVRRAAADGRREPYAGGVRRSSGAGKQKSPRSHGRGLFL